MSHFLVRITAVQLLALILLVLGVVLSLAVRSRGVELARTALRAGARFGSRWPSRSSLRLWWVSGC